MQMESHLTGSYRNSALNSATGEHLDLDAQVSTVKAAKCQSRGATRMVSRSRHRKP